MNISEDAIKKIKEFEGLRVYAYKDSGGVWTCGYGHTEGVTKDTKFCQRVADEKLRADLKKVESSLQMFAEEVGGLTQGQWDALADFIFNLGWGNFATSSLKARITWNKNDALIGQEFKKWKFCKGKELRGLALRRAWEAQRYYE